MSDGDGRVIKIGLKGKVKVEFGDILTILVDVVAVQNAWVEVDQGFRNEKNEVDAARVSEHARALQQFVCGIIQRAADEEGSQEAKQAARTLASMLSLTNAMEFMARMTEEAERLKVFFEVRSSEKPSSPESTELRFST